MLFFHNFFKLDYTDILLHHYFTPRAKSPGANSQHHNARRLVSITPLPHTRPLQHDGGPWLVGDGGCLPGAGWWFDTFV